MCKIRFDILFESRISYDSIRYSIRPHMIRFDSGFDSTFFGFKIRFENSAESSNLKIRESYDSTNPDNNTQNDVDVNKLKESPFYV